MNSRTNSNKSSVSTPATGGLLSVLLFLLLAGCASLPTDYPRAPSRAWDRPEETRLGRAIAPAAELHPGLSGFRLLQNGMDAFVARMALANAAERTLDLQYYIVHNDFTGKLIIESLIRAAERGVRVRILIDDTAAKGRDAAVADLASCPGIQVRIFNPAPGRSPASWLFSAAADFDRVNRRMHNKMFVADNQVGVVGGRNIGDEYFAAREAVNFADVELLAAGPVVQELSRIFDEYWNSQWAFPIEALYGKADASLARQARKDLAAHAAAARDSPYGRRVRDSDLLKKLLDRDLPLVWAPAAAVSDSPEKAAGAERAQGIPNLASMLRPMAEAARAEIVISSPYFIPGTEGVRFLGELRKNDVHIRVITNSFAGNDVAVVHAGYARYRKDLLTMGVELYELKPFAAASGQDRERFGSSGASLHAKVIIIDREHLFVGSLNLDNRSVNLNTELGIIVESRDLAEALELQFEELILPQYSYRLALDPSGRDLLWISEKKGSEVRYTRDPEVGVWRRFSTWVQSIFVPEDLL
jgi:putative cardiolipin synthase